jgi:hypothetical protein
MSLVGFSALHVGSLADCTPAKPHQRPSDYRDVVCPRLTCSAKVGASCRSYVGRACRPHGERIAAAKAGAP